MSAFGSICSPITTAAACIITWLRSHRRRLSFCCDTEFHSLLHPLQLQWYRWRRRRRGGARILNSRMSFPVGKSHPRPNPRAAAIAASKAWWLCPPLNQKRDGCGRHRIDPLKCFRRVHRQPRAPGREIVPASSHRIYRKYHRSSCHRINSPQTHTVLIGILLPLKVYCIVSSDLSKHDGLQLLLLSPCSSAAGMPWKNVPTLSHPIYWSQKSRSLNYGLPWIN